MKSLQSLFLIPWYSSLYFSKGLSYVAITALPLILYKQLGLSNPLAAFYASLFYLPWVLKPIWTPIASCIGSYRSWILFSQMLSIAALVGWAHTLANSPLLSSSLPFLWVLSFSCCSGNWAIDNFYRMSREHSPLLWKCDIRLLYYRMGTVFGLGFLVMMAGNFQVVFRNNIAYSWSLVLYCTAGVLFLLCLCHIFVLPRFRVYHPTFSFRHTYHALASEARNRDFLILGIALFLFLLPEALNAKVSLLFLLDPLHRYGLGLSPQEFGLIEGSVCVFSLIGGGMLGNRLFSSHNVQGKLWIVALVWTLPNVVFICLSYFLPRDLLLISGGLCLKSFGYGIAFIGLMQIINHTNFSRSNSLRRDLQKAVMAFSFLLPGLFAGYLLAETGYVLFFCTTFGMSICSCLLLFFLRRFHLSLKDKPLS